MLLRPVGTSERDGPILQTTIKQEGETYLIDGLPVDGVIACWPQTGDVWLIPIVELACCGQTIRMAARDDWLVEPIARAGSRLSPLDCKHIIEHTRAQARADKLTTAEAVSEQKFYSNILS